MAGYTLSALEADIRSYTEVSSTVLTGAPEPMGLLEQCL